MTEMPMSQNAEHDGRGLQEKAAVARDAIADLASEAKHFASDRLGMMKGQAVDKAKRTHETVVDFIKRNPYKSLAIAAGAGLVIGMILKRR